jgi:formylglycine-generating enzyme required for sulfatase activity
MSFIFISYSRQDQAYVDLLVQALESHRLPVWMDQRIDYGTTWPYEIEKHLEQCQVFLLVMSPRSKASHWVQCELSLAIERKKPIFPLRLEGGLWLPVRAFQAVDVTGGKLPLARFFESVRAYFPTGIETAESLSVQAVAAEKISAVPASVPAVQPSSLWRAYPFETVRVNGRGEIIERSAGEAQYFAEDLGDGVSLEMVRIPGGEFLMGAADGEQDADDDESPQHWVTVPECCMGKFPITQAQYRAVMGHNPSEFKGAQRPVENVSWQDAVAFCEALSELTGRPYCLPSEAEWEYACRAGTTTPFYVGPTLTTDLANHNGNHIYGQGPNGEYRQETTDVREFPPNSFGLYDLHGNVWEWCQDNWHGSYKGAPVNGVAWTDEGNAELRVCRGGSWYDDPDLCRSAFRGSNVPGYRDSDLGFRVVCGSPWTS